MVGPVAKAVDAQRAGVFARSHAAPCGHGDGWGGAGQLPVGPRLRETPDIGQMIDPLVEHQGGFGAVQSENGHLFDLAHG